jgi:hypothetical protein
MTNLDPRKLAYTLVEHGNDWADKNAAAELLEENRRNLRSQIAMGFLPEAKSLAKAEMMAEDTDQYRAHIAAMVEARKHANKARVLYDSDKAYIDLLRSWESTKRAEMNMAG